MENILCPDTFKNNGSSRLLMHNTIRNVYFEIFRSDNYDPKIPVNHFVGSICTHRRNGDELRDNSVTSNNITS